MMPCYECDGDGFTYEDHQCVRCPLCHGDGKITPAADRHHRLEQLAWRVANQKMDDLEETMREDSDGIGLHAGEAGMTVREYREDRYFGFMFEEMARLEALSESEQDRLLSEQPAD